MAITFTEAAAAEMAERVARALADLAAGRLPIAVDPAALPEGEELRKVRAGALLAQLHRLRVRTIHSFCLGLLQSYPIEAGLDPAFEVDADGLAVDAVAAEVVEEAAGGALLDRRDRDWLDLVVAGADPPALAETVKALVEAGVDASDLERDPFPPTWLRSCLDGVRGRLGALLEAEGGSLAGARRSRTSVATRSELEALAERLGRLDPPDPARLCEAVAAVSEASLKRLREWARGVLNQTETVALGERGPGLVRAAAELAPLLDDLVALSPAELETARRVVVPLVVEIRRRLRSRGLVTYHDLLAGAASLLERHPWLTAQVQSGIDQLLVDEFQDTDRLQARVVELLALDGPAAGRPGLFLVGDPKQSIYGWRDADLEAYEGFLVAVERAGGLRSRLAVNYRSAPAILDEVERVVAPVMTAEAGLQPAYEPLLPCPGLAESPGFAVAPWGPVEHWVSWPLDEGGRPSTARDRVSRAYALEAAALAADLVALHERGGVPWAEVLVLLRATSDLDLVLAALREAGVPFSVARDREYFRRREIVEAAALVRVLVDPSDQLSLLALLRSDVVGVPDAALLPLWRGGFADAMVEVGVDPKAEAAGLDAVAEAVRCTPVDLPEVDRLPHWGAALTAAVESVALLRRSLRLDPPDRFVERLRSLWLGEATAAARYLGRHRWARLEAFFAELERLLEERGSSRAEVARFLRRAVEEGREPREPAAAEVAADAVRVMTIHRAKGLEAPHVYLLQLHRRAQGRRGGGTAVLRRGAEVGYRLFDWPTPAFLAAERWQGRVGEAELVRLLYVAATRAEQRLVLAGLWSTEGGVGGRSSLADLVERRGGHEALAEQAASGVERRGEGGVLWVLPQLVAAAPAAEGGGRGGEAVDPPRVAAQAEALAQRRAAAAARAARPWSAGASAEARRLLEAEERAARLEEGLPGPGQEVATAVGTSVHRLLETLDLGGDLAAEVGRRRAEVEERLRAELEPATAAVAVARVGALLERLGGGELLARLGRLAPLVVARELPLLLPPEGDGGPVGFVSARVDLVHTDPESGELVVVDYKTDEVAPGPKLEARAAEYAPQLELYARGLEQALDLARRPRAELWFLAADRRVVV